MDWILITQFIRLSLKISNQYPICGSLVDKFFDRVGAAWRTKKRSLPFERLRSIS